MKKLSFDKEKYIKISIWKLLSIIIITLILVLIAILNKAKITTSDIRVIVLIDLFFICCYSLRLYLNYKYYKDNYECYYKDGALFYKIVRYANIFESLTNFFDAMVSINLVVDRLDKVEKKFGRIYVYGKMTLEKTVNKPKIKIKNKYSFPDYCVGEENLKEYVKK